MEDAAKRVMAVLNAEKGQQDLADLFESTRRDEWRDFSQAEFKGMKLKRVNMSHLNLDEARFIDCDLENAKFEGSRLLACQFSNCNLNDAIFFDADLSNATIHVSRNSNIKGNEGTRALGAKFQGSFQSSSFVRSNFESATFDNCDLSHVHFESADLRDAKLINCAANNSAFSSAIISDASIQIRDRSSINFNYIVGERAHFAGDFSGSHFEQAKLADASFVGCRLDGASFASANLERANLLNVQVNGGTNFSHLDAVNGCRIDRFALACLENFGGLTPGNRAVMDQRDDAATLRSHFSGFWLRIHLAAVLVFVSPYALFLARMWAKTKLESLSGYTITIGEALAKYTVSGGNSWTTWDLNFWSLLFFVFFLVYNVVRLSLLWKTQTLEMSERINGLPPLFSFKESRTWLWLYWFCKWGIIGTAISVIGNTINFLMTRISLP